MSDDNDTMKLAENDGSLSGDALLQALRGDMQSLFGLVRALDQKVEALDQKVDARLHNTQPMWELVASRLEGVERRLDSIEAEQKNQGARLDSIEGRLDVIEGEQRNQGARLDSIEQELRLLRKRTGWKIGELSHDMIDMRAVQYDHEGRLETLEKTPG